MPTPIGYTQGGVPLYNDPNNPGTQTNIPPVSDTGSLADAAKYAGATTWAEREALMKAGSTVPTPTPALGTGTGTTTPDWAKSTIDSNPFDTTSRAYQDAKMARDQAIENAKNKQINQIRELQGRESAGVGAQFQKGSRTGASYDSIKDSQINDIRKQADKSVQAAEEAAANAKITGDQTALDNATKQLTLALQIRNQATTEALNMSKLKLDALTTAAALPKGQEFEVMGTTYEGQATPESFFKSADITKLMLELPAGETREFPDPVTGDIYTITGLSSNDPNVVLSETINNSGDKTIVARNKVSGDVLWQTVEKGVGKTGGSGTSVTLQMSQQQAQDLQDSYNKLNARRGATDALFDSNIVKQEYERYAQENPGKANQFLDMVKGSVNYNDQVIKDLYGKKTSGGQIEIKSASGATIKI
jgi:hypothetical protein